MYIRMPKALLKGQAAQWMNRRYTAGLGSTETLLASRHCSGAIASLEVDDTPTTPWTSLHLMRNKRGVPAAECRGKSLNETQ
jgi:hypothetical protein